MTAEPSNSFLAISVGEKSPFPPLPPHQLTVATVLRHVIPVVLVSLPNVTAEDIASIRRRATRSA